MYGERRARGEVGVDPPVRRAELTKKLTGGETPAREDRLRENWKALCCWWCAAVCCHRTHVGVCSRQRRGRSSIKPERGRGEEEEREASTARCSGGGVFDVCSVVREVLWVCSEVHDVVRMCCLEVCAHSCRRHPSQDIFGTQKEHCFCIISILLEFHTRTYSCSCYWFYYININFFCRIRSFHNWWSLLFQLLDDSVSSPSLSFPRFPGSRLDYIVINALFFRKYQKFFSNF